MGAAKGSTLTIPTPSPSPAAARPRLAVAVDGGNSKTEVVVLQHTAAGLVECHRGIAPGSGGGPQAVVASVRAVIAESGADPADVTSVSAAVAGLDFPGDEAGQLRQLRALFPAAHVDVVNDAVAVLDAGAGLGPALAIVCGAGLNAVARGPAGLATVPAVGWSSGDWGGGDELGREAVRAAARAEDGRGPHTVLLERVLAATGAADTVALARALRDGELGMAQVGPLAAEVARAADEGDAVAAALMARAAAETDAIAGAVARRAWPDGVPAGTTAVLAGGLFGAPGFRAAVATALRTRGFVPEPLAFRPVDGMVRALRERAAAAAAAAAATSRPLTAPRHPRKGLA